MPCGSSKPPIIFKIGESLRIGIGNVILHLNTRCLYQSAASVPVLRDLLTLRSSHEPQAIPSEMTIRCRSSAARERDERYRRSSARLSEPQRAVARVPPDLARLRPYLMNELTNANQDLVVVAKRVTSLQSERARRTSTFVQPTSWAHVAKDSAPRMPIDLGERNASLPYEAIGDSASHLKVVFPASVMSTTL